MIFSVNIQPMIWKYFLKWVICTAQPAHKCSLCGLYLCLTERKFMFLSTLLCRSRQKAQSNKQMSTRFKALKYCLGTLRSNLQTSGQGSSVTIYCRIFCQKFLSYICFYNCRYKAWLQVTLLELKKLWPFKVHVMIHLGK